MNKEELKKTLWNGFKSWEIDGGVETEMVYVPKQVLYDSIDQLDEQKPEVLIAERTVEKEPEKPVVPSFVAEWHEKNEFENWWNWLYKWGKEPIKDELEKRVHDWFIDYHEYDFVDMHRIGYTAEEKKYRVKLGKVYIGEFSGIGNIVFDKKDAFVYTAKEYAEGTAELTGGTVEEVQS